MPRRTSSRRRQARRRGGVSSPRTLGVAKDSAATGGIEFATHPKFSRFHEFGLDIVLTRLVSSINTDFVGVGHFNLTWVFFVVGHVFGAPIPALLAPPALYVLACENEVRAAPVKSFAAIVMLMLLIAMVMHGVGRVTKKDLQRATVLVPGVLASLGVPYWFGLTKTLELTSLYYMSWSYCILLCWVLKGYFLRARPASSAVDVKKEKPWQLSSPLLARFVEEHTSGVNSMHSFPSFDTAGAACCAAAVFAMGLQQRLSEGPSDLLDASLASLREMPPVFLITVALAAIGRIFVLAHHAVDVLAGGAIGAGVTCFFGLAPQAWMLLTGQTAQAAPTNAVLLPWALTAILAVFLFMFVPPRGPFLALALFGGAYLLLPSVSTVAIVAIFGLIMLTSSVFTAQSVHHKPWVVESLKTAFAELGEHPACLSEELKQLVEKKRREFFEECAERKTFPGNIYVTGKFRKHKRLIASWQHISNLIDQRFDHFAKETGVDLNTIDVVLGIYSGGAILAPMFAERLGVSYCLIKVSRYKNCNLSMWDWSKTALLVALGLHDSQYSVSRQPEPEKLRGKSVLLVDDACMSGGTFRAAAEFCKEVGAREVRGLAICGNNTSHIWDPTMKTKPSPQIVDYGTFTPWGTY